MDFVVCHYAEVALKGKNRRFFEEKLVESIKRVLKPDFFQFVKRISGRIIVKLTPEAQKNQAKIKKNLKKVFGIANFAFACKVEPRIEVIQKKAWEILAEKKFKTFKIDTQRSKKDFPLTSQQINEKVGEFIVKKLKKKVDLKRPDIACFIEIVEDFAFLYLKKIKGLGGLPTSTAGKVVSLLSGGIDSPVASFQIMKRGAKIIFLHFHSLPYTSEASIEKAKEIIKVLSQYQGKTKLYLVPFAKIQEEILKKTSAKLRVILYRRFMMRIAQKIAQKEKALALVTGESLGQVASQTLENIGVIEQAIDLPILRPLIGQDKSEIIKKARQIKTFEISILPHEDCCARFLPRHPETRAKLEQVLSAEKNLDMEKLIDLALKETEKLTLGI